MVYDEKMQNILTRVNKELKNYCRYDIIFGYDVMNIIFIDGLTWKNIPLHSDVLNRLNSIANEHNDMNYLVPFSVEINYDGNIELAFDVGRVNDDSKLGEDIYHCEYGELIQEE